MFKTPAAVAATLSLAFAATAAPAGAWELIDWNGGQVWGAEWTPDTRLTWSLGDTDVWFRIYFDGYASNYMNGNQALPGLAATVLYRLTDISANHKQWTFDYEVENASHAPVQSSTVSLIGFDVTPDVKSQNGVYLYAGGEYRTVGKGDFDLADDHNYEDDFDVCFTTKGSFQGQPTNTSGSCNPGANVGPGLADPFGSGQFTLKFSSGQSQVAFLNPVVAYDDIDYATPNQNVLRYGTWYDNRYGHGHRHSTGCGHQSTDDGGFGTPQAWVPEPATWAMMILGFGAVGSSLRSRRRRADA